MKKWTIGLLVVLMVALISSYFLIPATLNISKVVRINATGSGTDRFLGDKLKWARWWPVNSSQLSNDTSGRFSYNNLIFQPGRRFLNTSEIIIGENNDTLSSTINVVSVRIDSLQVLWQCKIESSLNPVKRISQYFYAVAIKNSMTDILDTLKTFLEKNENIYNAVIRHTTVQDSSLIAIKMHLTNYPGNDTVYSLINTLRTYSRKFGAKETNFPMLSIRKDSTGFATMVALPVDKVLPANGSIIFKRLIQGNLLVTEIKGGGIKTIEEKLVQMDNYVEDYQIISPAMPFESLVTDRSLETDTAKWVTRIYYPVF